MSRLLIQFVDETLTGFRWANFDESAEFGALEGISRLLKAIASAASDNSALRSLTPVDEAESGTMRLERQECDLRKSLEQVVTLYEYVAQEQNVDVILADFSSISLELDSTRISQVWANLLDNAIKYGHDGGWVKISVSAGEKSVVVSFADNGMGISPIEQKKIWERLYRGDRSRSQKGLGLGLNYVQAVVVAHGGEVSVESSLNERSCFQVSLPLNPSSSFYH